MINGNRYLLEFLRDRNSKLLAAYNDILSTRKVTIIRLPATGYSFHQKIFFRDYLAYGATMLVVEESYVESEDEEVALRQFHYHWRKYPGGKNTSHISAWGNEPHIYPPQIRPYLNHHHHLPNDYNKTVGCGKVTCLEHVFEIIHPLIDNQQAYVPCNVEGCGDDKSRIAQATQVIDLMLSKGRPESEIDLIREQITGLLRTLKQP